MKLVPLRHRNLAVGKAHNQHTPVAKLRTHERMLQNVWSRLIFQGPSTGCCSHVLFQEQNNWTFEGSAAD